MPKKMIDCMCKKKEQIEVLRCNSEIEEDFWSTDFNDVLWELGNLKLVNLFNCLLVYHVSWFEDVCNITTLILSGCNNLSSESLVENLQYLLNLHYLELMYLGFRFTAHDITKSVEFNKKLEVLNCYETGNIRPWMAYEILRSCPLLYKFYFSSLHRNDTTRERVQWYKIVRHRFPRVEFAHQVIEKVEDYEIYDPQVHLVALIDYHNDLGI